MTRYALFLGLTLMAGACGGSASAPDPGNPAPEETTDTDQSDNAPNDPGDAAPTDQGQGDVEPTDTGDTDNSEEAQRLAAATATAESTSNACAPIHPFYWELGDVDGIKASGSLGTDYDRTTFMGIASASKWLYGAYVVERRAGVLTDQDIEFLNFKSGYTSFAVCPSGATIDGCLAFGTNGDYHDEEHGFFHYGGGHMEKHASLNGLGAMDNEALGTEVRSYLGDDIPLTYTNPQPAGGLTLNAAGYATFLRKLLAGDLAMTPLLGSHAVCTNPATCAEATGTPVPASESWHYSIGHWVEDDPEVGDGAVSSPGAFGFYPWIDATRTLYGVLARKDSAGGGFESVDCGRLIRKAWVTGVAQ